MKEVLISIKPQWVAKILNGEKTIEIRKRFPKDYKGWVYIYHTKAKNPNEWLIPAGAKRTKENDCSGKVVARFWCDNVEEFEFCKFSKYKDNLELYNECVRKDNELCKKACISCVQMIQYLDTKAIGKDMFGKAIHISQLEIFDTPKELNEFATTKQQLVYIEQIQPIFQNISLTKAPQSRQYIEVEE